eukprot:gb/GECG01002823.1/.p1 GENE.gb/GECG01002823.1/~~gb/GECG01002823.1/.p1  ORF type:complete len:120 (+),score=0.55 gb/GECG01002823.1/:1-360(+)
MGVPCSVWHVGHLISLEMSYDAETTESVMANNWSQNCTLASPSVKRRSNSERVLGMPPCHSAIILYGDGAYAKLLVGAATAVIYYIQPAALSSMQHVLHDSRKSRGVGVGQCCSYGKMV